MDGIHTRGIQRQADRNVQCCLKRINHRWSPNCAVAGSTGTKAAAMKKGIFVFLVLTFALDCFSQSIADIARQERERQRTSKSKVAVIGWGTSASIVKTPSANAATAAEAPTGPKPLTITDNKGRDEK